MVSAPCLTTLVAIFAVFGGLASGVDGLRMVTGSGVGSPTNATCPALPALIIDPSNLPALPQDILDSITQYFEKYTLAPCSDAAPNGPSATGVGAAVVFGNQVQYITLGCADKTKPSRTITEDTIFRVASVSKTFVTDGVLRAAESGVIRSLDDEVRSSVPSFSIQNPFGTDHPTWRQLVSQLAGIPREVPCTGNCSVTTAQVMDMLADMSLILPPNYHPSYSNLAYDILGHLIAEQFYSESFEDWLNHTITMPLGMAHTGSVYTPEVLEEMVTMYLSDGSAAPFTNVGWGAPDGGIYTTPIDAGKWVQHWLTGFQTSAFRRENMQPRFVNSDFTTGFGSPWEMYKAGSYFLRTKSGDLPGGTAQLIMAPELHFGFLAMWNGESLPSNIASELGDQIIPSIDRIVRNAWRDNLPSPARAAVVGLAGASFSGNFDFTVAKRFGTLYMDTNHFGTYFLLPITSTVFQIFLDPDYSGPAACIIQEFLAVDGEHMIFTSDYSSATLPGVFYKVPFTRTA